MHRPIGRSRCVGVTQNGRWLVVLVILLVAVCLRNTNRQNNNNNQYDNSDALLFYVCWGLSVHSSGGRAAAAAALPKHSRWFRWFGDKTHTTTNNNQPSRTRFRIRNEVQHREENDAHDLLFFSMDTTTTEMDIHTHFMQLALDQARLAGTVYDEVPVGAILVRNITTTARAAAATAISNTAESASFQQRFQILSRSGNRVETHHDASAHAELLALRSAAQRLQNWRLNTDNTDSNIALPQKHSSATTVSTTTTSETILYSTLEPCPLCLAAAQAFRIQHVVYGAPDLRMGALGSLIDLPRVAPHPFHTFSSVTAGVCAAECGDVLRDFFRDKRSATKQKRRERMLPLPSPPNVTNSIPGDPALIDAVPRIQTKKWRPWTWLRPSSQPSY